MEDIRFGASLGVCLTIVVAIIFGVIFRIAGGGGIDADVNDGGLKRAEGDKKPSKRKAT